MDIPNALNSVLVEGTLIDDPSGDEYGIVKFEISSNYTKKTETGSDVLNFRFPIVAVGRLGQTCLSALKSGRGIRVVGRLAHEEVPDNTNTSQIFILAEHCEFKQMGTVIAS